MRRENDNPNASLIFRPIGGPITMDAKMENHGIELPAGKWIHILGLFTLGYLETDSGNNIEVARRVPGSTLIHLVTQDAAMNIQSLPVRLYPDPEETDLIEIPENCFNPLYNCHGLTFGDSEYWINPLASRIDNGRMVLDRPNIRTLLDDEYKQVEETENWDIAVLLNENNDIVHSVKRIGDDILSKYDDYQLKTHTTIEDVEDERYGIGHYEYYRIL